MREKIKKFVKMFYSHPTINIAIIVAITIFFGIMVPRIEFDNDLSRMIPYNHRVNVTTRQMEDDYGGLSMMMVGIKSKSGNILTVNNIKTIEYLTNEFEKIGEEPDTVVIENKSSTPSDSSDYGDLFDEFSSDSTTATTAATNRSLSEENNTNYDSLFDDLDSSSVTTTTAATTSKKAKKEDSKPVKIVDDVMSITNGELIAGVDGGMEAISFKDYLPQTEDEIAKFKEVITAWDIYEQNLYSKDFSAGSIVITLGAKTKTTDHRVVYDAVKKITSQVQNSDLEFYISGSPALTVLTNKYMMADLGFLIPMIVIVLVVVLFLSFRNFYGIILPLTTVGMSTIWTVGLMAIFGKAITTMTVCLPVALMAVGSAYGIHIITHYIEDSQEYKPEEFNRHRNRELILQLMLKVGVPVVLASVTTMAGFFSLMITPIIPLMEFGLFCGIGVIFAVIISLVMIPSFLMYKNKRAETKKVKVGNNVGILETALNKLYKTMIKHKVIVFIIIAVFVAITLFGISKIKIDNQIIKLFKSNSEIVLGTNFINEKLSGTNTFDLNIIGDKKGALANPEVLKQMDNLATFIINKYPQINKAIGFHDFIKRMNEVMHSDEEGSFYEIPYDPAKYNLETKDDLKKLISQYLLLYSGNLDSYAAYDTIEPERARMTMILTDADNTVTTHIMNDINEFVKNNFPEGYTVEMCGSIDMSKALNTLVINGQVSSLPLSLILVFLIVAISFRSLLSGLIGIIPLTFSLLLNFGIMGLLKIDLSMSTALIASLAVGIGVDYTIHFLVNCRYQRKRNPNFDEAVEDTYRTSGKAIIFNASAVGFGFLVMIFSNFIPLQQVGMLVALVMFSSSFFALTILPFILKLIKPKFIEK